MKLQESKLETEAVKILRIIKYLKLVQMRGIGKYHCHAHAEEPS